MLCKSASAESVRVTFAKLIVLLRNGISPLDKICYWTENLTLLYKLKKKLTSTSYLNSTTLKVLGNSERLEGRNIWRIEAIYLIPDNIKQEIQFVHKVHSKGDKILYVYLYNSSLWFTLFLIKLKWKKLIQGTVKSIT